MSSQTSAHTFYGATRLDYILFILHSQNRLKEEHMSDDEGNKSKIFYIPSFWLLTLDKILTAWLWALDKILSSLFFVMKH